MAGGREGFAQRSATKETLYGWLCPEEGGARPHSMPHAPCKVSPLGRQAQRGPWVLYLGQGLRVLEVLGRAGLKGRDKQDAQLMGGLALTAGESKIHFFSFSPTFLAYTGWIWGPRGTSPGGDDPEQTTPTQASGWWQAALQRHEPRPSSACGGGHHAGVETGHAARLHGGKLGENWFSMGTAPQLPLPSP